MNPGSLNRGSPTHLLPGVKKMTHALPWVPYSLEEGAGRLVFGTRISAGKSGAGVFRPAFSRPGVE